MSMDDRLLDLFVFLLMVVAVLLVFALLGLNFLLWRLV